MKQLLILSGKGGTGKTTIAAAFIRLGAICAYADCDVDAPNLHLALKQKEEPVRTAYYALPRAEIDPDLCISCGNCARRCRFDAVMADQGYRIDPFACEGCGVCEAFCPAQAITMRPQIAGELALYATNNTAFSTARLKMGSGTSGKLVTQVKRGMVGAAPKDAAFALIDGSPGIGCPVIASMSGVDMVLIVTEPTVSGLSDLARIVKTADIFQTKVGVCVNKADINPEIEARIEEYCCAQGRPFLGTIPFDPEAVRAVNRGQSVADVPCPAGSAVRTVYENTIKLLFAENQAETAQERGEI